MLTTRHEDSVLVGRAEVNHAAAADKFGLDAPLTTELSAVYLEALDAKGDARRHREVVERASKKISARPVWMRRLRKQEEEAGQRSKYTWEGSVSVLAMLDTCTLGHTLPMRGGGLHADPHLRLQLFEARLGEGRLTAAKSKWKKLHKSYRTDVGHLRARQAKEGGDEREWQDKFMALCEPYRVLLMRPYEEERSSPGDLWEPAGLLAEAAALLEVVYEHAQAASSGALANRSVAAGEEISGQIAGEVSGEIAGGIVRGAREYHVAFAWHVAGDFLLYIKEARLTRERNPERALFERSL